MPPERNLRERILDTALGLFAAHGYHATSLQNIATAAGCSKAALLYHFASKAAILRALLDPLLQTMSALDAELAELDDVAAREHALHGLARIAVTHRRQHAVFFGEIARLMTDPELAQDTAAADRLLAAATGRSVDQTDHLAAFAVVAGVAAACARYPDTADDVLVGAMTRLLRAV